MSQPPGFVDPSSPHHVCKLNKVIYGLKQASRAWYAELRHYLISHGFKSTHSDNSLFIFPHSTTPIYIIVYVDDIIITGPSIQSLDKFISMLADRFSLKDLGTLSYFLGVECIPHSQGLFLSQSKYIHNILTKTWF